MKCGHLLFYLILYLLINFLILSFLKIISLYETATASFDGKESIQRSSTFRSTDISIRVASQRIDTL